MSRCRCRSPDWEVVQRHRSTSPTFHLGLSRYSAMSVVRCRSCGKTWRSAAVYVADLPNAAREETAA